MEKSLLFLDMLGVRSLWKTGGEDACIMAFQRFRDVVEQSIEPPQARDILQGEIESDAAALLFNSTRSCIKAGRSIFRNVFINQNSIDEGRMWLRGAIVNWGNGEATPFRQSRIINRRTPTLLENTFVNPLLKAISVEKAGFKGMRLLIENSPSRKIIRQRSKFMKLYELAVPIAKRLQSAPYPTSLDGYMDILWMASETEDEWDVFKATMNNRLQFSARNTKEFIHAAATQVVFSECGSFANSVRESRAGL